MPLRVRRSIQELQTDYKNGNKKPLEDLMRAWKGIKDLPPDDPKSFLVIGGYHGEPFRGAGWGNASYWGGYCNHGNVLFPTWHRVYLVRLEEALQSIPGCDDVMQPYWDETSQDSLESGVPWALTQKDFVLDGVTIPNPLRSFIFNRAIVDNISPDPAADYSKPKGYETVRYPLSGLVAEADRAKTEQHNARYPDYNTNVELLNANVVAWLTSQIVVHDKVIPTNVHDKYTRCLDAPNYTVFSNTTSAQEWNNRLTPGALPVVPLESPHNSIHLAIGGCDIPTYDRSPIEGANGDMGENDTAGLDPIFFFHHAFVDRVFWLWQQRHRATDELTVIEGYPGTNTVDSQGPTPGVVPNTWLTLDSPLDPFRKKDGKRERPYTSQDCINIEKQLGYTYSSGSMEDLTLTVAAAPQEPVRVVHVSGINRGTIRGSFMISAYAQVDGKRRHLGTEAVLSRWHVQGCANCQAHLEAKAFIPVRNLGDKETATVQVEVRTRDGLLAGAPETGGRTLTMVAQKPFRFEVR